MKDNELNIKDKSSNKSSEKKNENKKSPSKTGTKETTASAKKKASSTAKASPKKTTTTIKKTTTSSSKSGTKKASTSAKKSTSSVLQKDTKKPSTTAKKTKTTTTNSPKTSTKKTTTTVKVKTSTATKTTTKKSSTTAKKTSPSTTKTSTKKTSAATKTTTTTKPKTSATTKSNTKNLKAKEKTIEKTDNIKTINEKEYPKRKDETIEKRITSVLLNDSIDYNNTLSNINIENNNLIEENSIQDKSKKTKQKKKDSIIEIIVIFTIVIGIIIFGISFTKISIWDTSRIETNKQVKEINEITEVKEVSNTETTEIIEPEVKPDKFNPYWDYIKMDLIDVDMNELKKINDEAVGWLKVEGTNINYPFVQHEDNEFYLNRSFNKTKNQAGWVFMDYRNNPTDFDKNTILYGHAHKGGAVFGSLNKILESKWQSDTDNYIVKMSTETENTLWQVFSIYSIPYTSDYIKTEFPNDDMFKEFVNMLINRSVMDFKTTVDASDKILTLSSCYLNSDNRIVLHAKLIKKDIKN